MAKYVCSVCGYVHEGDSAPDKCPVCNATTFKEVKDEMSWACQHVVGSAKGYDKEVIKGLIDNFNGECAEVGMLYLVHISEPTRLLSSGCWVIWV
ncbi:MAG: hypothetical protein K2K24_04280, partial [Clostridia bacterium]|nr:hypothetical protein [Clostridia bacterium]